MLSKTVTDRVRANGSVLAALQHLAPMLENQGAALFAPHLKKGETLPDLAFLATLLQRVLQSQGAAMEKADSDHNDELADDLEPRERRDEAVRDLYSSLVDLKQGTGALFGESWVSRLKLPGTLPQEPVAIESRGYVALVHGGFKILRRKRYDTIELYDLAADPGEKVNLFREDDPVSAQHMSAMDKFFDDVARK